MGELALIAVRYCPLRKPALALGLYECAAAWVEGRWRWKRLRLVATAATVNEFVLQGYKVWRVRPQGYMEMFYEDCLYWDNIQGADYVP